MSTETTSLSEQIGRALLECVSGSEEPALLQAYDLGRAAIHDDSGLLRLVEAYREALAASLADADPEAARTIVDAWGRLLMEGLGPFEMAHEGYRDANDSLARLNRALQAENHERRLAESAMVEARDAAERANRAKSMFLSRMSHELRTPLNAILGFAQLLDLADLEEEHADGVRRILTAGRHLLDLINEVLDIGRIEAGELTMSIEPVELQEVVESAIGLVRPLAAEPRIEIVGSARGSGTAMADRQRLHQVLLNLLSNAVKYNRAGGSVVVAASASDGMIRVEVSDTGRGLSEDQLSRLFVPFDRLGAEERYDGVEGSGLGLSLSKTLIEAMHGRMGVETELGAGSTFWFEIPEGVATPSSPAANPPWKGSRAEGPARTASLLYIEDNPSNIELVERILADRPDLELLTARLGRQGLDIAAQRRPDVILLDLHLPDMPGDEVFRLLRQDPDLGSTPVVIITADATPGRRRSFERAGVSGFLTKPLDVVALRVLIEAVLSSEVLR